MTKKSKKIGGLGRGMDALFNLYEEKPQGNEFVEEINLSEIRPNPYQPRKIFSQSSLKELADSIKQSGVFQPVIVRQSSIKGYELIAGERRVRASKLAGKETIPAIVRQLDEEQMIEIAIIENLQREDLSPLEEAEAYQMMMDKLELTQAQVAEKMGKSRPYIANYLRLLSLPSRIKDWVNNGELSMAQARTLLSINDKSKLIEVAKQVIDGRLTVRQLEERIQKLNDQKQPKVDKQKNKNKDNKKTKEKPTYIIELEHQMQEYFGTQVTINESKVDGKGKIEIEYLSQEDLTRLMDLLNVQL